MAAASVAAVVSYEFTDLAHQLGNPSKPFAYPSILLHMPVPEIRLYFENAVGRVLEHPDSYALIQYHSGPRQMHLLQAFLTHTGQLLQLRGWHRLISDHRVMVPFTGEESTWILEYWLTRQTEGGGTIIGAGVFPAEQVAQMPAAHVEQEAHLPGLTFRMFTDEKQAAAWLQNR